MVQMTNLKATAHALWIRKDRYLPHFHSVACWYNVLSIYTGPPVSSKDQRQNLWNIYLYILSSNYILIWLLSLWKKQHATKTSKSTLILKNQSPGKSSLSWMNACTSRYNEGCETTQSLYSFPNIRLFFTVLSNFFQTKPSRSLTGNKHSVL
jgi:hypothetical protein